MGTVRIRAAVDGVGGGFRMPTVACRFGSGEISRGGTGTGFDLEPSTNRCVRSVCPPKPAAKRQSKFPQVSDRTNRYLKAMSRAPAAMRPAPAYSWSESFSPRNRAAKTSTSTTLNLSTGATCDALPNWSARK